MIFYKCTNKEINKVNLPKPCIIACVKKFIQKIDQLFNWSSVCSCFLIDWLIYTFLAEFDSFLLEQFRWNVLSIVNSRLALIDWHVTVLKSLKKPTVKTIIKQIHTALTKLNCILQPFHVWKVQGISHMYDITNYEGFGSLPVKLTNSSMSFTFNGTCTIPQRW